MKAAAEGPSSSSTHKAPVTRANPTQTAALKKAYTRCNTASPDELKALSQETGLPAKWIHQWFGRQRLKERRSGKAKTAADTSGSDPMLSPQEIMNVKMELRDALLAEPFSPIAPPSVPASVSDSVFLPASSSGSALESISAPAPSAASKSKQKAPAKAKKAPVTRTLRSRKKEGAPPAAARSVKAEIVETAVNLRYTPESGQYYRDSGRQSVDSRSRVVDFSGEGQAQARLRSSALASHNPLLPCIAPPKRSPITSANGAAGSGSRNRLSNLSKTDNYSTYASESAPADQSYEPPTLSRSRSQRNAVYQQGPVFHTQFQNNGPSTYSSRNTGRNTSNLGSVSNASAELQSSVSLSGAPMAAAHPTQAQFVTEYTPRPLAPAFDWENNSASTSVLNLHSNYDSFPPTFYQDEQTSCQESQPYDTLGNYAYLASEMPFHQEIIDLRGAPPMSMTTNLIQESFMDVLNPSLAPLKHLTGILEDFKAENGSYAKLMAEEWRETLLGCLLNEELAVSNPFQAAMGLSLLSKLGFEWEY